MELSWSSFILETLNFLVLLWILKHFLYAPLQQAILRRQQAVQNNLDKAQALHDEALKLQLIYENRLNDWETEKEQKMNTFQQEWNEWKSQDLLRFEKTLAKEQEKMHTHEMKAASSIIKKNAQKAMLAAGAFAAKFLTDFASADLESKIIVKAIHDLSQLSDEKRTILKNAINGSYEMMIKSAYPLNASQRDELTDAIDHLSETKIIITFQQDPDLLAGLIINMDALSLQANLKNELTFFTDLEYGQI